MDLNQMTDLLSGLMASQANAAAASPTETASPAEASPAADASAQDLGPLIDMAMKAASALLSSLSESGTDLSGLMQSLLGGSGGASADQPGEQPAPPEAVKTSAPMDLSAVANAVKALGLPGGSSTPQNAPNFKASNQKTQLLRALKPYMNPRRAGKIDRAISMLDTAYTARTALKLFTGSKKQGS